ncbi:MAG: formate dehydrogenase accessory sulfurtransferase FdhD [Sandaracinaceae bacterium]
MTVTAPRLIARFESGAGRSEMDDVAVEEPLEIRVAQDPLLVTMRTPGADRELTLGWLKSEGIVESAADVASIAHCGRPTDEGYGNVVDVLPAPGVVLDLERMRGSERAIVGTSACGTCGRRSIDDLMARIADRAPEGTLSRAVLEGVPEQLRALQPAFARTGGLHGAAAFDAGGEVLGSAEDVGRHNAVDKVIGAAMIHGRLDRARILAVSGRVSFEIVQKAATAGLYAIVAVGAPTTLAIDLAGRAGITLLGFVRRERFNAYTHAARIED